MRRFAAVFASKRSDKSESASSAGDAGTAASDAVAQPKSRRFFRSLSKSSKVSTLEAPKHPAPPLPKPDQLASSSASSCSGPPTTPDDDYGSFVRTPINDKPWTEWQLSNAPLPASLPSLDMNHPRASDRRSSLAAHTPYVPPQEESDESSSESSSSTSDMDVPVSRAMSKAPPSPSASPLQFVQRLTSNSLVPSFSPPPLLYLHGKPLFPRSSNAVRELPFHETLESFMHRRRLLRRLEPGNLAHADEQSFSAFGVRKLPAVKPLPPQLDDTAVQDVTRMGRIGQFSQGLRRWADRPCFEERLVVYTPVGAGDVISTRISGLGLGVAALEFSEDLELLAGLYEPDAADSDEASPAVLITPVETPAQLMTVTARPSPIPPSLPSTTSPSTAASMPPKSLQSSMKSPQAAIKSPPPPPPATLTAQGRSQSYRPAPSPLRRAHDSSVSVTSNPDISTTMSQHPASSSSVPKQAVRFAEEEKPEHIPLSYVLRIKQKREEKARFLKQERERRAYEEERRKHEAERYQWEQERLKWERERRAIEEDRKQKAFAEEVIATRQRRENQRMGGNILSRESEREREREWERRERELAGQTRPANRTSASSSPRRHDPELPAHASGSRSGSFTGSRPPSIAAPASSPSRPSSTRPNSSQQPTPDAHRERRESRGSRRSSTISDAPQQWMVPDPSLMPPPSFWNMRPNMPMNVTPVAVFPMVAPYAMDMPLLPPTPPFMMQQFGYRPPQQRSHSSSPTLSRGALPSNRSSERIDTRSSSSSPNPHHRGHQRHSSGDAEPRRPSTTRSQTDDRRSSRSTGAPRTASSPAHLSRPPPPPLPATTHAPVHSSSRTSWAIPQDQFQILSRPSPNRRQTVIT